MNPFRFGTIVEKDFFTDRKSELEEIKQKLDSENHLVLISPRRFGKSSLINKVLSQIDRPSITVDLMKILSVEDFASSILKSILSIYPIEKVKHLVKQFRIEPKLSYSPITDTWDVSFIQAQGGCNTALEDSMNLIGKVTQKERRLIVVFDEFQEINDIDKSLAKQLRAIIQRQSGVNYIFMGSQESMMNDIFEKKKSPFYHFGHRINLKKMPYDDFFKFIIDRLPVIPDSLAVTKESIAEEILKFTGSHPYYTQQLASDIYDQITYREIYEGVVETAIKSQVEQHDLDYERLWVTMNRTDRKILRQLSFGQNPLSDHSVSTSTTFSALKKLIRMGYVNKIERYELEDPFFGRWIKTN